jgi:hypothetical protein
MTSTPIQDLFEVTKTLHFELKPSEATNKRIPQIVENKYLEANPEEFLNKASAFIDYLKNTLGRLRS